MKVLGICIITEDVPRLRNFYCKILNTDYNGDDNHSNVNTEGAGISIFSANGMEKMAPGSMKNAGFGNFSLGISIENIDEAYKSIKAMGVEIVKELQIHPWGNKSFWFRDPDGNIVNFLSSGK